MSTQPVDQQNHKRDLQPASIQSFKKAPLTKQHHTDSSDMNNISPIMYQRGGDKNYLENLDFYKNPMLKENSPESQMNLHFSDQQYQMDIDTPNSLSKNIFQRPSSNLQYEEDTTFKKQKVLIGRESLNKQKYEQQYLESEEQDLVTAKKETNHHNSNKNKNPLDSETCTEFDLIAKEISSNKRQERMGKMMNPHTQSSKVQIDSPLNDELKSGGGSELSKWAFSKDSQQQTQKKVTTNNNPKEIITRTLRSHDSESSNIQQKQNQQQYTSSQSSSNQQLQIKGKMLDFGGGNSESSHKHNQFVFMQNNNNSLEKKLLLTTEESQIRKNRVQQINSFLGDDDEEDQDLLIEQRHLKHNYQSAVSNQHSHKQRPVLISIGGINIKSTELNEPLQDLVVNNQECQLCFEQKLYHSSIDCSKLEGPKSGNEIILENLNRKYLTSREYYNVKIINDIIYNENTHIVSVFKDYLIFDDVSEFLKRYYNKLESVQRLPRMFEFYEKYSKVFANYVVLPENKYMFKNIERKQRLQDEIQRILMEKQNMKNNELLNHSQEKLRANRHKDRFSQRGGDQNSSSISQLSSNRMFNTKFIESVANIKPSGFIEPSLSSSRINISTYQEHVLNSSALQIQKQLKENYDKAKNKKRQKKGTIEDLDMDELISKFIAKDTESNIQSSILQSASQEKKESQNHVLKENVEKRKLEGQFKNVESNKVYEYKEKGKNNQIIGGENNNRLSEISKQSDISIGRGSKQPPQVMVLGERTGETQKNGDGRRLSATSFQEQRNTKEDNNKTPNNQKKEQQQEGGFQKNQQVDENTAKNLTQIILNQQNQENKIELNIIQMLNNSTQKNEIMNDLLKQCELQNRNQKGGFGVGNENLLITLSRNLENYIMTRNGEEKQQQQSTHQEQVNANSSNKVKNLKSQQQQSVKTPSKVSRGQQDQKTPTSGDIGRKGQVQKQAKKQYVKGSQQLEVEQENNRRKSAMYQAVGGVFEQNQQCISINDNKSVSSLQRYSNDPQNSGMSPRAIQQNISSNNNVRQVKKIVNLNGKVRSDQVNSNAVTSREMSKEKRGGNSNNNENLFKNEQQRFLIKSGKDLQLKQCQQQELDYDVQNYYNNNTNYLQSSVPSSNVRSIEKLKLYEEEIEKDYSKYQNEYGLSKIAIAKTLNTIREKSQSQKNKQEQDNTRGGVQGSVEKGRRATSNNRGHSNSQSRKLSSNRQAKQMALVGGGDSEYMNVKGGGRQDSQKNIRSIRTKTINSQNSSTCMQKSQKLSPDKAGGTTTTMMMSNNPNLMATSTLQNLMMINQSEMAAAQGRSTSQQNFITLKTSNPSVKGLKIKMPLNQQTSRGNSQSKNILQKGNNNNSQTQTPKRLKLQKTKSTSNININKMAANNISSNQQSQQQSLATSRGRMSELGILSQMSQYNNFNPSQLSNITSLKGADINYGGTQPLQLNQMNELMPNTLPHQIESNQNCTNSYFQSNPFAAGSCLGTYATTSILNSPLSFKQNQVQTQRGQHGSKSNNGRNSNSRNGNQSQHQSQKSIHQRAGSSKSNNILIGTHNKGKVNKRMSEGNTSSKMLKQQQQMQSQLQSNPMLLNMILQQQYQNAQSQQDMDFSTSTLQAALANNSQLLPFSQTLKTLQSQMQFGQQQQQQQQQQSMKNLKSLKLSQGQSNTSSVKEIQMIKPSKIKQGNIILMDSLGQQQFTGNSNQNINTTNNTNVNTTRQSTQQPTILGQVFKAKVANKSGKNTARGEEIKKKINVINYQQQQPSQVNETRQTGVSNMDSTLGNQEAKRILGYSKSQESLDLIKYVAQKVAQDQIQQQYSQTNNRVGNPPQIYSQVDQSVYPYQNCNSNKSQNRLSDNQVLFSKLRQSNQNQTSQQPDQQVNQQYNQYLQQHQISSTNNQFQQPPPTLQTVRNMQFNQQSSQFNIQANSQFQFKNEYEGLNTNSLKTPTAVIMPPSTSDKVVQSRRTSSKFNPSSTKHN